MCGRCYDNKAVAADGPQELGKRGWGRRWTLKIEQCMKHHENDGGTR